jgi:hypothetical protein
MNPDKPIKGHTRVLGAPSGWDHSQVPCGSLAIKDSTAHGQQIMESVWYPTHEELQWLNAGQPVRLTVFGQIHPPIAVGVGDYA